MNHLRRWPFSSLFRVTSLLFLLLCVVPHLSCIGVTRLPARTQGPEGRAVQSSQSRGTKSSKEIDLNFLQAGNTRREDVESKLGQIDTMYSDPRLFWGRWGESKWGYWWFVAAQTGAAGDAARIWYVHNLLVTFDQNGIMQDMKMINDERTLWRELHANVANLPKLDLSEPISFPLTTRDPTRLTLSKEAIHVERQKASKSFDVSPQNVVGFKHQKRGPQGQASSVASSCHKLQFAEETPYGKSISFCAKPIDVATLLQYLHEYGPADLLCE